MISKKWVGRTLALASAFIMILVILLTTIEQSAFDRNFFQSEYKKLNQTEIIGISEQDLMQTTEVLLDYIQGNRDNLSMVAVIKGEKRPVFNEREIAHMVDVQILYAHTLVFRNAGVGLLFLLLLLLRLVMGREFLRFWAGGYLWGAGVFFGLLVVMALAISRDFLLFWNKFHMVFFTNDLWLLNPETDILIQIVPEQFFFDLVIRILLIFTLVIIGLAAVSGVILHRKQKAQM